VKIQIWCSTKTLLLLIFRNKILVSMVNSRTTLSEMFKLATDTCKSETNKFTCYYIYKCDQLRGLVVRVINVHIFFLWRCGPTQTRASSFLRFLDHTQRPNTFGTSPLDEWPARRRDLNLKNTHTHTHTKQTNINVPGRIRTYNLSRRAVADLRCIPREHRDRYYIYIVCRN